MHAGSHRNDLGHHAASAHIAAIQNLKHNQQMTISMKLKTQTNSNHIFQEWCLVCACVLGSVPRLLPDALAPSVSPRTPPCPVSRSCLRVRQLLLPHRGKPPASYACSSVRSGPNGFAIGQLPGLSGWKVQTCGRRPGVHGLRTSLNHRLHQEHPPNRLPVQCWILGPQRRHMHRVRHREIQGCRRECSVQ